MVMYQVVVVVIVAVVLVVVLLVADIVLIAGWMPRPTAGAHRRLYKCPHSELELELEGVQDERVPLYHAGEKQRLSARVRPSIGIQIFNIDKRKVWKN